MNVFTVTAVSFILFNPFMAQPPPYQTYTPYYYKLAIQWPNSFCNRAELVLSSCTRPIPQRFTIHGLWGFDRRDKSIPYCTSGPELVVHEVVYKMTELKHDWPNLWGDDFLFWSEEWKKHGRCLTDMTPQKYFDLALDVMGQVGPLVELLLDAKGLEPDKNRLVRTQDFPSAIEKQLNTIVEVKCNKDKNDLSQIHELYFCASVQGELANCTHDPKKPRPPYKIRHCPTDVLYPSDPSTPLVPATPLTMTIPATPLTIAIPGTPLTMTILAHPIYIVLTIVICVLLGYNITC